MSLFDIIGKIVFGLIVGAIAKLLMPGKDPGGFIITAIIGMAGALIGTFIGRAVFGDGNYAAGWIMAILGALVILALYRVIAGRSNP